MKTQPAAAVLDMEQAIALLKTTRPTFYRWLRSGRIKGMKVGRQWRFYRQDIERFLKGEPPRIDLPASIDPLVETLEEQLRAAGVKNLPAREENLVVHAAKLLIRLAVSSRASDIHIAGQHTASQPKGTGSIRLRIDGLLKTVAEFDLRLVPAIIDCWKTMAACDLHEHDKPQDGRIMFDLDGEVIDLRVNFLPAVLGETVTACLLHRNQALMTLDRYDYAPQDRERLLRALAAPSGLVFCTGPTGSGKTTTLYACLNQVIRPEIKVVSIEDPVEYVLPGVVQVGVNMKADVTFVTALRAIFRSDPDVILVGEIRDKETLQICCQFALTGHLVLSTLHTDDAPSALMRMVNIGVAEFLVADATKLIVAQRLMRRVCPECGVPHQPPTEVLNRARQVAEAGGLKWETLAAQYRAAKGCPKCAQTGYRGRMVISEMLEVTPEIGAALRRGVTMDQLRAIAIREGMTTIAADAVRRAALGHTTLQEALRTAGK